MLTVCIAAYRAEAFIAETVRSVLSQTVGDLTLRIAVDPPDDGGADGTLDALAPFRRDPRVELRRNPARLGWAENIDALLRTVDTPYFAILPHDDLWAPTYLEVLLPHVRDDPDVSVAYADMTIHGLSRPGFRAVVLPRGEDRGLHLLRFHLQDAHAMPWRGVTRTSALAVTGGYPTDGHRGFAVESEYALGLLAAGRAIHVPDTLYGKRKFPGTRVSASEERLRLPKATLHRAWMRHRDVMLERTDGMIAALGLDGELSALCRTAAQAAMLSRRVSMVRTGLTEDETATLARMAEACGGLAHPMAPDVVLRLERLIQMAAPAGAAARRP